VDDVDQRATELWDEGISYSRQLMMPLKRHSYKDGDKSAVEEPLSIFHYGMMIMSL
ncbi:hypothetical protein Ciccas_005300, partial [Cichlidogyrus casuarinus]